ncbi:MAG: hypothetical protein PGN13_10055 [Patulibacter minatonensis]
MKKPINAADILRESFRMYGAHAATVVGVAVAIQAIGLVTTFVVLNMAGASLLGGFLLSIVGAATSQASLGAMTLLLVSVRLRDETPAIGDLLRAVGSRLLGLWFVSVAIWFKLAIIGIATGLVCALTASWVPAIPGVIIAFVVYFQLAVATSALIVRDVSATNAMEESKNLTEGHLGSIFVLVLFQFFVNFLIPLGADRMSDLPAQEVVMMGSALLTAVFGPLAWLAIGELYFRLASHLISPFQDAPAEAPRGPWVAVNQSGASGAGGAHAPTAPYTPGGPYVPGAPAMGGAVTAAAPYGAPAAPAPYGAPAGAPYGSPQAPAPHVATAPYGAPAPAYPATPAAVAAAPHRAPYAAPAQPGAPQPYGAAPALHGAPSPYAPPPHAPAPYGVPTAPAPYAPAPGAPYGAAPNAPGHHGAAPAAPAPYGAVPVAPAPHAPAAAAPYAAPAPAPGGPAYPVPPAHGVPGGPPIPQGPAGGPSGPVSSGRAASVAPPGFA